MIQALVFDLDGVLVDAADWHAQALNKALGLFGYSISHEEHQNTYNGLPTLVKLRMLSKHRGFPVALHGFVNEMKQKFTREIFLRDCRPRPELSAALHHLRGEGYRVAVASNSSRTTVELALEGLELEHAFDVVLSHEDVGRSKPDPEVYRECFRRLDVQPSEALILEDSEPGIRAARESRAHVMVIKDPSQVTLGNIQRHVRLAEESQCDPPTVEILIPMAGKGQRFIDAGFPRPKPFISVLGRPMIEWVVENLRPAGIPHVFTFLVNEDHLRHEPHRNLLERVAPGCRIVSVPTVTQGAACTALLASDVIEQERPLLIANSDQFVDFSCADFVQRSRAENCDGNILIFPATDPKWSYALTDEQGNVSEVAEKNPISPDATVGVYYFRTAATFMESAQRMIRLDRRTRDEFYVCPVYNELIALGGKVRTYRIAPDAMHGMGTPEDLQAFLQHRLKPSEPVDSWQP